ncbi:MAG: type IV conjugative transfer system coupling protein TraD [Gammaproteobacteria bacterium]
MSKELFKNTTRGGQVILHDLRMLCQVLWKTFLWALPIFLIASWLCFFRLTNLETKSVGEQWVNAKINQFFNGKHHTLKYTTPDGQIIKVYPQQITTASFVQNALTELKAAAEHSLLFGGIVYLSCVIIILLWLHKKGHFHTEDKHLKGDYLSTIKVVNQMITQQKRQSDLTFGKEKLMLPKLSELQHILVHGTTGCGKSTVIKELLDHIRRRGERAIVYDKSCNLMGLFYQPDSDKLLNPLDSRGVVWDLWQECRDKADFDNLDAALIPMSAHVHDPFWINAARTILAVAAYNMRNSLSRSTLALLNSLLNADTTELQQLLKGTEAESLMSEKAEKTAASIKTVLATYLKSLCYLQDGDDPFSIRSWIQEDTARGWLFISSLGDKHETLKPLISTWLDIAINALLSLPESPERRIWIILDELGSLQQLPYLTAALAESRKFGGCFVVGIQSYAQLAKIYSHEGGREISSLLNTRFLFRVPDPEIAQWSAKNLGETTLEETQEGISYGTTSHKDGVSIQKIERERSVVPAAEIMRLPDLSCYVRLAGAYPITKLQASYQERVMKHTAFLPVFDSKIKTRQIAHKVQLEDIEKIFS